MEDPGRQGLGEGSRYVEECLSLQALTPMHTAARELSHFVSPHAHHAMLPHYVGAKKKQSQETMGGALPPLNYFPRSLVTMEANRPIVTRSSCAQHLHPLHPWKAHTQTFIVTLAALR